MSSGITNSDDLTRIRELIKDLTRFPDFTYN